MGARGASDVARQRAALKPPPDREAYIGNNDQDIDRHRFGWDAVWIDPDHAAIAAHLDLLDIADTIVPGYGPLRLVHRTTHKPVGGTAAGCIETAREVLEWVQRGRVRAGGYQRTYIEITHEDGTVVTLCESVPIPAPLLEPPRILVLALDDLVRDWIGLVNGDALAGHPATGIAVDHPLWGLKAREAKDFARQFVASTPNWRDFGGSEQADGSRRDQLREFEQAREMERIMEVSA